MTDAPVLYRRVLLKLSGEALMGNLDYGIDPEVIQRIGAEVVAVRKLGVEVAIVIGGGNIFRGAGLARAGMDRVTGDNMGMLATIMNALAIQSALERLGVETRVLSAIPVNDLAEPFIRRRALRHLEKKRVVLLAGGTGNPYFTTDTTAALRALQIRAAVLAKGTKVDGVYSDDPETNPDAELYDELSFLDVLQKRLKIMDSTAVSLCMDNSLPINVFNMKNHGNVIKFLAGERLGTMVT